jgi:tetratricopeptide (TPR) repeat protein
MRRAVFFSLITLGILVVGTLEASAQNRISGFVFDEARRPVPQMYVELLDEGYSSIARTRTGGTGLFNFSGLSAGQYTVRVLVGGTNFQPQSMSVTFSNLAGARIGTEQMDFYLRTNPQAGRAKGAPGVVFAQEVPGEAKRLYESGVADLESKNEAGLVKIKESIEKYPDYFDALDRLGNEYLTRGYYEPAFVLFTKAVGVNAKSFSSNFGLGLATFRLSRPEMAVKSLSKAAEIDSSSINAQLWLGIALHSTKKFDEALGALKKASDLAGGTAGEVHWQLARVYKDQGKWAKAADALELYLKYKPDAPNIAEVREAVSSLRKKS